MCRCGGSSFVLAHGPVYRHDRPVGGDKEQLAAAHWPPHPLGDLSYARFSLSEHAVAVLLMAGSQCLISESSLMADVKRRSLRAFRR